MVLGHCLVLGGQEVKYLALRLNLLLLVFALKVKSLALRVKSLVLCLTLTAVSLLTPRVSAWQRWRRKQFRNRRSEFFIRTKTQTPTLLVARSLTDRSVCVVSSWSRHHSRSSSVSTASCWRCSSTLAACTGPWLAGSGCWRLWSTLWIDSKRSGLCSSNLSLIVHSFMTLVLYISRPMR